MSAGGPVVMCFGIVDEVDIVRDFIEYHASLGIERFVATDVGSTDGTLDILCEYERSGRLHLTRYDNPSVRPEHRDWLTAMAARARDAFNGSWCTFCDPDEFWVFPTGDAPSYFARPQAPIAIFPRYNMLPVAGRQIGEASHYRNFDLVVRRPLEFLYDLSRLNQPGGIDWMLVGQPPDILRYIAPKVAARPEIIGTVKAGFHDVIATNPSTPRHREPDGYVGHFQIRGSQRYANKARLVADYIANNPPEADRDSSRHWVRLAALYRHGLVGAEYARQILNPDEIAEWRRRGVVEQDRRIPDRLVSL
ncbi:MAG TPA: glycosyltransferase family 2 protein [Stellaceae bacterium]